MIVEAALASLDDGDVAPTAKRIAARAGVSERSVFTHFRDLDEIKVAAAHEQARRMAGLMATISPRDPLPARLDALIEQGERLYAHQVGIRTAESAFAPLSQELTDLVGKRRSMFRDQLAEAFAPELGTQPAPDQALDLLEAMSDWSFRHFLVARTGRTQPEASAIVRRGMLSALGTEPLLQ
ncbi:TetR/AcrR family transcriptional regulator [Nocardia sp. X0981]